MKWLNYSAEEINALLAKIEVLEQQVTPEVYFNCDFVSDLDGTQPEVEQKAVIDQCAASKRPFRIRTNEEIVDVNYCYAYDGYTYMRGTRVGSNGNFVVANIEMADDYVFTVKETYVGEIERLDCTSKASFVEDIGDFGHEVGIRIKELAKQHKPFKIAASQQVMFVPEAFYYESDDSVRIAGLITEQDGTIYCRKTIMADDYLTGIWENETIG